MKRDSKIYIAGHRGLVGSAILKILKPKGIQILLLRTLEELDLSDQKSVSDFFKRKNLNM